MSNKIDTKRGARMKHMREMLDYREQKAFAEALGVTNTRWSNVENGFPVGEDLATKLCRKFPGLDRDYVQEGDTRGLSIEMLRKLGLLPPGFSVSGA